MSVGKKCLSELCMKISDLRCGINKVLKWSPIVDFKVFWW